MRKNKLGSGKTMSMTGGLLTGAAISLAITIIGSIILSTILERGMIGWENIGYGILLILLTASFMGSAVSLSRIKRRRLLVSAESSGIYFAMLLALTALFFGGQYEAVGTTLCVICSGSMSALLLCKERKGAKRQKKYKKYC